MKKMLSILLFACMVIFISACNTTINNYQQNSEQYTTNSHTEISDSNESSEHEKTDYYVLNTRTKKIHLPSCYYAKKISEKNYATTDDLQSALDEGYSKCQKCHPK